MEDRACPVCGTPSETEACPRCGERRRFVDPRARTAALAAGLALMLLGLVGFASLAFLGSLTGHQAGGPLVCGVLSFLAGLALLAYSRRR